MKVRIKTHNGEKLNYETSGACAFDFKCIEDVEFQPGEFKLVETGTVVETPKGYVLQISPRSSTYKKHGLIQVNSIGIIDCDYCGNDDTIKFAYLNMTKEVVKLERGTRIGQGMFLKVEIADFELVDDMGTQNRGGFGTTGIK